MAPQSPLEPMSARAGVDSDVAVDIPLELLRHWRLLCLGPVVAAAAALGITYLIAPTFTSRTSFLPPQPPSLVANAASSLGALATLAGGGALRTPADQVVALLQSTTVQNRLVDRFDLLKVYDRDLRQDARRDLAENTRVGFSRRDGIVAVEVDDESATRAADIARAYVDELRKLTSQLAITEAQQRRVFFERQLRQTRDSLAAAQVALQGSGFSAGALKAEPKAAAEGYARLRAELTAAEVRLQSLRAALADQAPEVMTQLRAVAALRDQLSRAEQVSDSAGGPDYVGKYREFKYQETLFELFSRQYELARVDEAREGALIQVVDTADVPEKKSRPKRARAAIITWAAATALLLGFVLLSSRWRGAEGRQRAHRLKAALLGR
jgi:capsule polysaccharide export protein KpsE/RkpR